jgi:hypothetical protein
MDSDIRGWGRHRLQRSRDDVDGTADGSLSASRSRISLGTAAHRQVRGCFLIVQLYGGRVNSRWAALCLLICVACSRPSESPRHRETIPPGTAADSTELSPDESGPLQWTASLDSGDVTSGEQPRVMVRCEAGHLGAYVVLTGAQGGDSAALDDRAVPVTLDSAPAC